MSDAFDADALRTHLERTMANVTPTPGDVAGAVQGAQRRNLQVRLIGGGLALALVAGGTGIAVSAAGGGGHRSIAPPGATATLQPTQPRDDFAAQLPAGTRFASAATDGTSLWVVAAATGPNDQAQVLRISRDGVVNRVLTTETAQVAVSRGYAWVWEESAGLLTQYDAATGVPSYPITHGPSGPPPVRIPVFSSYGAVSGLAAADGKLWMAYSPRPAMLVGHNTRLLRVDGAVGLVAATRELPTRGAVHLLARHDVLYGMSTDGKVMRIDPASGAVISTAQVGKGGWLPLGAVSGRLILSGGVGAPISSPAFEELMSLDATTLGDTRLRTFNFRTFAEAPTFAATAQYLFASHRPCVSSPGLCAFELDPRSLADTGATRPAVDMDTETPLPDGTVLNVHHGSAGDSVRVMNVTFARAECRTKVGGPCPTTSVTLPSTSPTALAERYCGLVGYTATFSSAGAFSITSTTTCRIARDVAVGAAELSGTPYNLDGFDCTAGPLSPPNGLQHYPYTCRNGSGEGIRFETQPRNHDATHGCGDGPGTDPPVQQIVADGDCAVALEVAQSSIGRTGTSYTWHRPQDPASAPAWQCNTAGPVDGMTFWTCDGTFGVGFNRVDRAGG